MQNNNIAAAWKEKKSPDFTMVRSHDPISKNPVRYHNTNEPSNVSTGTETAWFVRMETEVV